MEAWNGKDDRKKSVQTVVWGEVLVEQIVQKKVPFLWYCR
jgi:hypothetical protein